MRCHRYSYGEYGWSGRKQFLKTPSILLRISILSSFPQEAKRKRPRRVQVEDIDKSENQAYFDGASQGTPKMGGFGGILHISDTHWISFKVG